MSIGIFLSYKGLGANLLHLPYCHQIAKKFKPVKLLTLCPNLKKVLEDDPLIDEVIYIEKYYKKFFDIINLSRILKKYRLEYIFIFYPSIRYYLAAKLSGIKNIYSYPLFKKKNLHLVKAAKEFTEKFLNINNCSTETKLHLTEIKRTKALKEISINKKNIIIGAGSSGPSTKWGENNYIDLIKKIKEEKECYFLILCGPNESDIAQNIVDKVGKENCSSLSHKTIDEVVPLISVCDLYIGNDSFGHHVASLFSKPSIILLLDTPRAYSDWSRYQNRIIPENISLDQINHGSSMPPNSIPVNKVFEKVLTFI